MKTQKESQKITIASEGTKENQQSFSFSRIKSSSLYDVKDFLPNQKIGMNKKSNILFNNTVWDRKNATEPFQKREDMQIQMLRKKIQVITYQKEQMKKQYAEQKELRLKREEEIKELIQKKEILQQRISKSSKPTLSLNSNKVFAQVVPKHQQFYEVSIQTDEIGKWSSNQSNYEPKKQSTSKAVLQIYQKFDSLKANSNKNTLKGWPSPDQGIFQKKPTTAKTVELPWMKAALNKQNNKYLSNFNFGEEKNITTNRIKSEEINIYPIDQKDVERIVSSLLD